MRGFRGFRDNSQQIAYKPFRETNIGRVATDERIGCYSTLENDEKIRKQNGIAKLYSHDRYSTAPLSMFANIETRNVATRLTCLPIASTQDSYDIEAQRYVPPFKIARANGGTAVTQAFMNQQPRHGIAKHLPLLYNTVVPDSDCDPEDKDDQEFELQRQLKKLHLAGIPRTEETSKAYLLNAIQVRDRSRQTSSFVSSSPRFRYERRISKESLVNKSSSESPRTARSERGLGRGKHISPNNLLTDEEHGSINSMQTFSLVNHALQRPSSLRHRYAKSPTQDEKHFMISHLRSIRMSLDGVTVPW
mmetsp:Transcript_4149/g.10037  ORF Transcript_4149/g.10037 Transcript_4149/m.10037 type:complete len:305 (-) Transcript_4149:298-1212(-)